MDFSALKSRVTRMKFFRDVRGQSMVEFAVAAPVLATLLFAICYVSDLYTIKYETLVASRYGAWRLSRDDNLTAANVRNDIAGYYFEDDSRINLPTPQKTDEGILDDILDFVNKIFSNNDHPTTYALTVEYRVPLRLGYLDMSNELPADFRIDSTHYVGGNAWDGCRSDVHDMFDMVWEMIKDIFDLF